jgi:hypothetical protein
MISTCFLKRPVETGVGFGPALSVQAADPVAGVTASGRQGDRPGYPVAQAAGPFAMPGRSIRDNGPEVLSRMEPFGRPPMRSQFN